MELPDSRVIAVKESSAYARIGQFPIPADYVASGRWTLAPLAMSTPM